MDSKRIVLVYINLFFKNLENKIKREVENDLVNDRCYLHG